MILEDISPQFFYHGTSSALGIDKELLPPAQSTRLSEVGRKKNLDKVFFTKDRRSAEIYAKKAVKQFGGDPIMLIIRPRGEITVVQDTPGTTVFMADGASVVSIEPITTPMKKVA